MQPESQIQHHGTWRGFLSYALMALPLAFLGLPLYLHLPKFYLEQYHVDVSTLGIALLCLRLGDACLDPLIGRWSDAHAQHRRSIFMIAAAVCVVAFNALFFAPEQFAFIWFIGCTALTYLAYSVLTINYYSVGLNQAQDYQQRTRLSAFRESAALIGTLLAALLPQVLQTRFPALHSFQIYGAVFGVVMVIGLMGLLPRITYAQKAVSSPTLPSLGTLLKSNKNLRWLFGLFFFNALPTAITSTLFLFYVDDVLHAKESAGNFLAVYFFAAIISAPVWSFISAKVGKRASLMVAMVLAMASFGWAFNLHSGDAQIFYIICVLSGFALGADMILLPSLLADVMDGQNEQGSTGFGIWHALSKWSLALAAGLCLPLLAGFGYVPGHVQGDALNPVIAGAYALIPCGFKLIALIILVTSPLDRRTT